MQGQTNILSVEEFEEQQDNLNDLSTIINDMDKLRVNASILTMFKMLINFCLKSTKR